jgi:hypothetical protein
MVHQHCKIHLKKTIKEFGIFRMLKGHSFRAEISGSRFGGLNDERT